jgi:hypothetical protein
MKHQKGFIALITILSASAVALLISSTILLRSITEATYSINEESSAKAWATVNACGEYALIHLASSTITDIEGGGWDYEGDYTLDVGDYSCYIDSVGNRNTGTTTPRIIKASSAVNSFVRKIMITAETNDPTVVVSSWEEVADF